MKYSLPRLGLAVNFGLTLAVVLFLSTSSFAQEKKEIEDVWKPFRPLIGTWEGDRTGLGGNATQKTEWKFVLEDKFIQCKTVTLTGEDKHADIGMISYDQSRKKFVYRSYFSEGFMNQYVATISEDGKSISFESEIVENGPPGFRVKETITIDSESKIQTECFLAPKGKPFKSCVQVKMKKK